MSDELLLWFPQAGVERADIGDVGLLYLYGILFY